MITIDLANIEELEEFEFVVDGERRITLSFNDKNFSVQISGGVNPDSIANSPGASFFLRKDYASEKVRD